MPLIFLILIIVLIAEIGFWNTLGAVFGAFVLVILLILLAAAALVVGGLILAERMTRPRQY